MPRGQWGWLLLQNMFANDAVTVYRCDEDLIHNYQYGRFSYLLTFHQQQ